MKIGYILSNPVFAQSNGIVSQALTWKKGLEAKGHQVVLVNMWDKNDWTTFDVLHFFGFSRYMADFLKGVCKVNDKIVLSPILDPSYSITSFKAYCHCGSEKLRLTNPYHSLYIVKDRIKRYLVRSEFEKSYFVNGLDISTDCCKVVPLSFEHCSDQVKNDRENFCLHISLLCDERKNVKRLIEAAKKFNFRLVLGGKLRNESEKRLLASWISEATNIEYLGFLSEEKKNELYSKAKVFALPSVNEGVGIVALEAASCGCDIVITDKGGPKEYYNKMSITVNPYSVDDIGQAVCQFLDGQTFQPQLSNFINKNYSLEHITNCLEEIYLNL